jgi:hypothetical protein
MDALCDGDAPILGGHRMAITFQPIVVDNDHDRDGLLILRDGALSAVMVRLRDSYDDPDLTNCWYVEASFANDAAAGMVFKSVHLAEQWFEAHHARAAALVTSCAA